MQNNLSNAELRHAELWRTDLTGADMSDTILRYVRAMDLQGCPAVLPTNWQCVQNNLVGPYADLTSADLEGANLSYADAELCRPDWCLFERCKPELCRPESCLTDGGLPEGCRPDWCRPLSEAFFQWDTTCPDGTNTYMMNPKLVKTISEIIVNLLTSRLGSNTNA